MAKARPQTCVKERAIAAFKKAHPSCCNRVVAYKRRSDQTIKVRGYESATSGFGAVLVWSYANNGALRRL